MPETDLDTREDEPCQTERLTEPEVEVNPERTLRTRAKEVVNNEITMHNSPSSSSSKIVGIVHESSASEKSKFLEGRHFGNSAQIRSKYSRFVILVILKRGSINFAQMVQDVAEFGGRIVTDIMNFDIKTIKKGELIYCISNEETRSPKYLACLAEQIPAYKQKWVEDMIKQKKIIAPSTKRAGYMEMHGGPFVSHYFPQGLCISI